MRELERTAAGFTSLERLRSVVAELDAERAGAGGDLPDAVRDALAVRRRRSPAAGVGHAGGRGRRVVCCERWCPAST